LRGSLAYTANVSINTNMTSVPLPMPEKPSTRREPAKAKPLHLMLAIAAAGVLFGFYALTGESSPSAGVDAGTSATNDEPRYGDDDPAYVLAVIDNGTKDGMNDAKVEPYAIRLRAVAPACGTTELDGADMVSYTRRTVRDQGGPELPVGGILDTLAAGVEAAGSQLGGKDGCATILAIQATLALSGDS
jgi:hypothetical protein